MIVLFFHLHLVVLSFGKKNLISFQEIIELLRWIFSFNFLLLRYGNMKSWICWHVERLSSWSHALLVRSVLIYFGLKRIFLFFSNLLLLSGLFRRCIINQIPSAYNLLNIYGFALADFTDTRSLSFLMVEKLWIFLSCDCLNNLSSTFYFSFPAYFFSMIL